MFDGGIQSQEILDILTEIDGVDAEREIRSLKEWLESDPKLQESRVNAVWRDFYEWEPFFDNVPAMDFIYSYFNENNNDSYLNKTSPDFSNALLALNTQFNIRYQFSLNLLLSWNIQKIITCVMTGTSLKYAFRAFQYYYDLRNGFKEYLKSLNPNLYYLNKGEQVKA